MRKDNELGLNGTDACEVLRRITAQVNELRRPEEDLQDCLIDLLADLMHLSHQKGLDFNNAARIARDHFQTERAEKAARFSVGVEGNGKA